MISYYYYLGISFYRFLVRENKEFRERKHKIERKLRDLEGIQVRSSDYFGFLNYFFNYMENTSSNYSYNQQLFEE